MAEQLNISQIAKTLNRLGDVLVDAYKHELYSQGHSNTGDLLTSITHKVVVNPDSIELLIEFNDYGAFVDSGRKPGGKRVPIDALLPWIEQKGLATGDTELIQLAYAIQTSIWKYGIPFSGWFTTTTSNKEGMLEQEIGDAYFQSVDLFFDKLVVDANRNQAGRTIS